MADSRPITLLAFAQARLLLGFDEKTVACAEHESPAALLDRLFPNLRERLMGCRVALDQEYASWDQPIGAARELALIPPVSGG